jgi:8-oxo-dGTP pyrophosphatase MutT (NUDIX family)
VERWDVYSKDGVRTGRVIVRGQVLAPDEYHLAVHIWIRNEDGDYLIQQRAPHLESGPGMWATTVGHVWAGEDSLMAACRETEEELGLVLQLSLFHPIHRVVTGQLIQDVYLVQLPIASSYTFLLAPEVSKVTWASKPTIQQMIDDGTFFGYSYFQRIVPACA